MYIDLHNHTRTSSACSLLDPEQLIETAMERGLDALCVTEHQLIEGANVAQALGRKMGFPVFRAIEARTDLGDTLVFGHHRDIRQDLAMEELCRLVHAGGGLVFVAHPFHTRGGRNLLTCLRQQRGLDLELQWHQVPELQLVDGIEVANGQASDEANAAARVLAARLDLPGIGGSDAHSIPMVARAATRFGRVVASDEALVAALKDGCFRARRLPRPT